jgi:hypothetical protein
LVSTPIFALIFPLYASDSEFGRLRVDTDPPGADVVIVAELGKTPLTNDFMNPGLYVIEIRHPNGKYMPVTKEASFTTDGQQVVISQTLLKPPVWTKKRKIQLALGTGTAAGFTWAIVEQHTASSYYQKSIYTGDDDPEKADEYLQISKNAGLRRTVAVTAAGIMTAALQITIFIRKGDISCGY